MKLDRKSTRLNSSHTVISYAVFCLKKKKKNTQQISYNLLLILQIPTPPRTTLFPYTTLFRSREGVEKPNPKELKEQNHIELVSMTIQPGEELIVGQRLRTILSSALKGKPA